MRVPRFWEKRSAERTDSRGGKVKAAGWGWSEDSADEASQRAVQTAQRVVQWLTGNSTGELHHYGYDERLPREEIIEEYFDNEGQPMAFISRNSYGALILNTRDLMFIDIDLPPKTPARPLAFLSALFGGKTELTQKPEELALTEIREMAAKFSESGFRIYRTYNGYRLMVPNRKFEPAGPDALEMLNLFHSDPLYIRMCKNQNCFRARLTPKTWRCDIGKPPMRYPFQNKGAESEYRRWETAYNEGVRAFSTCNLVEIIGPDVVHQDHENLVVIHDQLSKSNVPAPLA